VKVVGDPSGGIWAYPAIFIALVAAGLGFPIPEEIPVVTGGALCAKAASREPTDPPNWAAVLAVPGDVGDPIMSAAVAADWAIRESAPQPRRHPIWWIMLPVCILGVVVCDAFLYGIGRAGGKRFLDRPWVQRYVVKPERREKIEQHFHKYGVRTLLGVRLLPGIRAPVFIIAGAVHLPLRRFLLADGIYAIPVVTVLFGLAYWFTDSVVRVVHNFERQIGSLKHYFVIGGIAALGCWLLYEFWKRWVVTGDPKEVPLIGKRVVGPPHKKDQIPPNDEAAKEKEVPLIGERVIEPPQDKDQKPPDKAAKEKEVPLIGEPGVEPPQDRDVGPKVDSPAESPLIGERVIGPPQHKDCSPKVDLPVEVPAKKKSV
jgi:membrane protein DedA with SNARE-associated domain